MWIVGIVLLRLLQIYLWLLIGRMLLSWLPLIAPRYEPKSIVAAIFEFIYLLTDPPINAARKIIPPLRLGEISLDLAFMAVFFAVILAQRLVALLFF